jgi:hypothetical protein
LAPLEMTKGSNHKVAGGRSPPYPEMGCTTQAKGNAPFSLRLPLELRNKVDHRAALRNLSVGQYLRDLVEADLSGTHKRRRRRKYDELRQDLARIHAAIIACGNEIGCVNRQDDSNPRSAEEHLREQAVGSLKDAVAALIHLARTTGAR